MEKVLASNPPAKQLRNCDFSNLHILGLFLFVDDIVVHEVGDILLRVLIFSYKRSRMYHDGNMLLLAANLRMPMMRTILPARSACKCNDALT